MGRGDSGSENGVLIILVFIDSAAYSGSCMLVITGGSLVLNVVIRPYKGRGEGGDLISPNMQENLGICKNLVQAMVGLTLRSCEKDKDGKCSGPSDSSAIGYARLAAMAAYCILQLRIAQHEKFSDPDGTAAAVMEMDTMDKSDRKQAQKEVNAQKKAIKARKKPSKTRKRPQSRPTRTLKAPTSRCRRSPTSR